jgi:hypothetical protein
VSKINPLTIIGTIMLTQQFPTRCLIALVLGMTFGVTIARSSPRDELLRLVPEDMSFCLVVQDLRERSKGMTDQTLARQLAQMPFARDKIESDEFKKLLEIQQHIFRELEITPEQLRDDLLGDGLVFAYRQGPSGKPEQHEGVFLIWARDKALLSKVVDRINEVQKKSGELEDIRSLKHDEQTYLQRTKVKNAAKSNEFYFIREHVLAFSQSEAMIKAVIERGRNEQPVEKQAPYWTKMLERLGLEKSLMTILLNPRVFDRELKVHEASAKGDAQAFLKEFRKYWEAVDGLGVFADLRESLEFGVAVQARKGALPVPAQQFFAELGNPSALWKAIPLDPLFAIASRFDVALFVEVFSAFCDESRLDSITKSMLGGLQPFMQNRGKFNALNPFKKGLGPDWGLWANAPGSTGKTWVPDMLFAVKVRSSPDGAAAERAIQLVLQALMTRANLVVEVINHDKVDIRYVHSEGVFPPGFRPAFASKEGFLLFASSPEAIQRFSLAGRDIPTDEVPLLRISAIGWRSYLSQYKNEVGDFLAKSTGMSAKDVAAQIDIVTENLKAFDRFEIVAKSKADQATLTFRLKGASASPK